MEAGLVGSFEIEQRNGKQVECGEAEGGENVKIAEVALEKTKTKMTKKKEAKKQKLLSESEK